MGLNKSSMTGVLQCTGVLAIFRSGQYPSYIGTLARYIVVRSEMLLVP